MEEGQEFKGSFATPSLSQSKPMLTAKNSIDGKESEKDFTFSNDPLQAELERRICKVFDVFDTQRQKIVDVREVGTMVRAMDLCPTEAEVQEIISAVEEPSSKGCVRQGAFVRYITFLVLEGEKYQQHTKDEMLRFFHKLDPERLGTVDPNKLKEIVTREGEPFTPEEADEMINFALNKDTGLIHYADYVEKTLAALRSQNF